MGDDTRRIILARRARFVAAAIAGVTASTTLAVEGCGGSTEDERKADASPPRPCLSIIRDEDGAPPQACLSPLPPRDAGFDADASGDADANTKKDANPQPCLAPLIDSGK